MNFHFFMWEDMKEERHVNGLNNLNDNQTCDLCSLTLQSQDRASPTLSMSPVIFRVATGITNKQQTSIGWIQVNITKQMLQPQMSHLLIFVIVWTLAEVDDGIYSAVSPDQDPSSDDDYDDIGA